MSLVSALNLNRAMIFMGHGLLSRKLPPAKRREDLEDTCEHPDLAWGYFSAAVRAVGYGSSAILIALSAAVLYFIPGVPFGGALFLIFLSFCPITAALFGDLACRRAAEKLSRRSERTSTATAVEVYNPYFLWRSTLMGYGLSLLAGFVIASMVR